MLVVFCTTFKNMEPFTNKKSTVGIKLIFTESFADFFPDEENIIVVVNKKSPGKRFSLAFFDQP